MIGSSASGLRPWGRPGAGACLAILGALVLAGRVGGEPLRPRVEALLAQGAVGDAEREVGAAKGRTPGDPDLEVLGAEVAVAKGDYTAALHGYREALALRPGDAGVQKALKGLRRPLTRELREVLAAGAGGPEARHALAFLLALEGKRDKALAQLRQLGTTSPEYGPGWMDRAWLESMAGQAAAAFAAGSKAVQLDPARASIRRQFRLLSAAAPAPVRDEFYGLLEPVKSGAAPGPSPPATVAATGEGPRLDFDALNLTDDSLVASLLRRIEIDTTGVDSSLPATATDRTSEPARAPGEPSARTDVVPTPLEVVKKLQDAYDQGVAALGADRYEEAEKAFALVVSLKAGYRDAQALLKKAEKGAEQLERFDAAITALEAGEGGPALGVLGSVDKALIGRVRPDENLDARLGEAYFLTGNLPAAEKHLAAAIPRRPTEPRLRYRLFLAQMGQKRTAEAAETLALMEGVAPGYAAAQPGHRKLALELFVRRWFLLIALLATLWALAVVGYVVFAGSRKARTDFTKLGFEKLAEALRGGRHADVLAVAAELGAGQLEADERIRVEAARLGALIALGKVEEAGPALERARGQHPQDPQLRVLVGKLALARGGIGPADIPWLGELIAAEPGNRAALDAMHAHYLAKDDYSAQAHEVLRRLIDLSPADPALLERESRFRLRAGDVGDGALVHHQRTVALAPRALAAIAGLAACLAAKGRHLEAIARAKEGLQLDPRDDGLQRILLDSYLKLELYDEGLREFARLEREQPGSDLVAEARGQLEAAKRRVAEVKEAAAAEERELGTPYDQGVKLFSEGRFVEAIARLRVAEKGQGYRLHAGALRVRCHLALGEFEAAAEGFASLGVGDALQDEFMVALCYDMAGAFQGRGRIAEACELYRKVCRADVEYKDAFARYEELQEQLNLAGEG